MPATLPLFATAGDVQPAAATPATPAQAAEIGQTEALAAARHFAAALAGKLIKRDDSRDDLPAGSAYHVRLQIAAEVNGVVLRESHEGELTIGHDSTRAGSAPTADALMAFVAARLNSATRAAVLRDVVEAYGQHGPQLGTTGAARKQFSEALKDVRAANASTKRGDVRLASYQAAQPGLAVD